MSTWFMRDNQTFTRLDELGVDTAFDKVEEELQVQGGYGFLFVKKSTVPCPTCGHKKPEQNGPELHIRTKELPDWRYVVRQFLIANRTIIEVKE